MITTALATPSSSRNRWPRSAAADAMPVSVVACKIAAASLSGASFFCGIGTGPVPRSFHSRAPEELVDR